MRCWWSYEGVNLWSTKEQMPHYPLLQCRNQTIDQDQCSRLKALYEFHFEGLVKIQEYINEIQKSY